jgi:type III pantothenate kinase
MELDLLLDIGNTRSKWLITKSNIESPLTIEHSGVINNHDLIDQIQLQFAFLNESQQGAFIKSIYCTCVGQINFLNAWQAHFPSAKLHQLTSEITIPGFENGYQRPSELGTDRLAGMLGAIRLFPLKNILVIAAGTATTIDYLHQGSQFKGGWIMPGLDLMLKSLGKSTANLPTLVAHEMPTRTANLLGIPFIPLGTSTKDAIEMGACLATIGAIQQAIKQLNDLDLVLMTGGNALILDAYLRPDAKAVSFIQEPNLILLGINEWRLHHKESKS